MEGDKEDSDTIEVILTKITLLSKMGSYYKLSVNGPREYINSTIFDSSGVGFIISAYDDILGKPAELALIGKPVGAYYDVRNGKKNLFALKPLP